MRATSFAVPTLLALALLLPSSAGAAAGETVRSGPAGARFHAPPAGSLRGSAHGGVIWAWRQTGPDALGRSSRTRLVLYRSIGTAGRAVAVSGSVSLPRGRAPRGGWPVVSWAHGTSGIADRCAPTRNPGGTDPVAAYHAYAYPLLERWLAAGYAVVRADYEGLGTPGDHPYLIGRSEGRATLDVVRAARRLEPSLSRRLILAGHSQGGHSALWATSLAKAWTPELRLAGTAAFAPASHLSEQVALASGLASPGAGLSGLASLLFRGMEAARAGVDVGALLSEQATALYPQTRTLCVGQLAAPESFGGLAPAALGRPGSDLGAFVAAVDRVVDPENLRLRTPVLLLQGEADGTVFPVFTGQLNTALTARGAPVTYRTYPGVTHGAIIDAAAGDATRFIARRLSLDPPIPAASDRRMRSPRPLTRPPTPSRPRSIGGSRLR